MVRILEEADDPFACREGVQVLGRHHEVALGDAEGFAFDEKDDPDFNPQSGDIDEGLFKGWTYNELIWGRRRCIWRV